MFNAISQRMHDYYDEIPSNTFPTLAKAAIFSFTATLLMNPPGSSSIDSYARPLVAAGIGVLATLIHALATPIFNAAFGNDRQDVLYQESVKTMVVVGLTRVLISYATVQKLDLLTINPKFNTLSINFFKSLLHLVPQTLDWLGNHREAADARNWLWSWGLDAPNGTNSTYLVC